MKPAFAEDLEQTLAALGPVFAERAAGECLLRCESIPGCLAGNLLVTSGQEIKSEITRLASRIGASDGVLPTFGFSEGWSARPHIEVDGGGYHYVVEERGHENSRLTTRDPD